MTASRATIDKLSAYLEAHPEGVTHLQTVTDLGLASSTAFNNLRAFPKLMRKRMTRYFLTDAARDEAAPALHAEWAAQIAWAKAEKAERRKVAWRSKGPKRATTAIRLSPSSAPTLIIRQRGPGPAYLPGEPIITEHTKITRVSPPPGPKFSNTHVT